MILKKQIEIKRTELTPECWQCDFCKKKTECGENDITTITARFGYGSRRDCEIWSAEICDRCFDKLFMKKRIGCISRQSPWRG